MKFTVPLASIFILYLTMAICEFCGSNFGDRGLKIHSKKCPGRVARLQTVAAQAVAVETARIETQAANASSSTVPQDLAFEEVNLFSSDLST
jgi:hypothetical protein